MIWWEVKRGWETEAETEAMELRRKGYKASIEVDDNNEYLITDASPFEICRRAAFAL